MAVSILPESSVTARPTIAQRLLATTARQLAEASDLSLTLGAIADAAVPGLADWAGVDLLSPSGDQITTVAVSHRDPEKVRLGWHLRSKWPVQPDEPEGIAAVHRVHPEVPIYCAAVDRELNERKFIVPGLGDAGDRLFGT